MCFVLLMSLPRINLKLMDGYWIEPTMEITAAAQSTYKHML